MKNPSKYSIVLVSEGAMFEGGEMVFKDKTTDAFGHAKLVALVTLFQRRLSNYPPNIITERKSM
jgi:6-phosphofructokinase 1